MKDKISKIVSYVTIAPVMAFGALTLLFFADRARFGNLTQYILAAVCLTLLPVLAYPLQGVLPKFKDMGRKGQRKLAFITGVAGYTLGMLGAILLRAPRQFFAVYLSYFFSGIVLAFFNKVLKIKASGHACGVMGPVILCVYYIGSFCWSFFLLLPAVFWARLKMSRHTIRELLLGSSVSLVCTLSAILIMG